ncbi:Os02g0219600 [Oryza sativa Japonica Group]|nr:Os02g0219600 [Oryza sativa Japonica Group]
MAERRGRGLDGDEWRERCAADGGQREREWRPPSAADDVEVDLGILGDSLFRLPPSPIPFYRPGRSVPATAIATGPLPPRRSGHRLAGGGACPAPSPRGPQPRGASSLPPLTPMDAAAAAAPRGVTGRRPSSSAFGGPQGDGTPWSGGEKGGAPLHSHRHAESADAQPSTAAPASPAAASPRVALPHHAGPSSPSPPSPAILSIPTAVGLLFSTPPRRPSQSTAAP